MHGLSTAWHLARELKARGRGSGADILVIDKSDVGAGASGIACGVIRNFYYQPAMGEVMRLSVEIWEAHAEALSYHPVGYVAVTGTAQQGDLETIFERQQRSGYRSDLITGERAVYDHMCGLFPDWKARGLTACLHERQGGFAFNKPSLAGLGAKVEAAGVKILPGSR